MRAVMVRLHRYVGLSLAAFLIVIGATGCIIAWFNPLDEAVNDHLWRVEPAGTAASPLTLRAQQAAADPRTHYYYVHFPKRPDEALSMYTEAAIDPATGEPYPRTFDEVFVDPYTGKRLGERMWGSFSFNREDLITQVYFLHYSLVLPEELGEGFMGWVAAIWAIDCLVGLYLTLPLLRRREGDGARRGFWSRWGISWRIKRNAGSHRRTLDIHRAVSLWVWTMLLVFAISGFALNLPGVYDSVMRRVAHYEDIEERTDLARPLLNPPIGWDEALARGQRYMAEMAVKEGFTIERPTALIYRREKGVYYYRVQSSRDVVNYGMTIVGIDGTTGALAGVEIPTGHRAGNTFTSWTMGLHMAMVGGTPWKVFISVMGLVVVTLSVTGIMIWRRKTRGAVTAT